MNVKTINFKEETYFKILSLLSKAHESWIPEEFLGFCSMFEIFPKLGIQVAAEVYCECTHNRLISKRILKTLNIPS